MAADEVPNLPSSLLQNGEQGEDACKEVDAEAVPSRPRAGCPEGHLQKKALEAWRAGRFRSNEHYVAQASTGMDCSRELPRGHGSVLVVCQGSYLVMAHIAFDPECVGIKPVLDPC